MGQCVTVKVGNKSRVMTDEGESSRPSKKSKKSVKIDNDEDSAKEEEEDEEQWCDCIEDVVGCLPCM